MHFRVVFPVIFFCPSWRFSIFVFFIVFFYFLNNFTKMKAYAVCATAQASFFTVFWPFSQRNCSTVEEFWTTSKHVIESKDFRRQTKEFQSFEPNGMEIYDQQRLESLEEKKAVHTSCKHGVRRICKLYSERTTGRQTHVMRTP